MVECTVALLQPLRPQQLAQLNVDHAHTSLKLPAAGAVECSVLISFWVIGSKWRDKRGAR